MYDLFFVGKTPAHIKNRFPLAKSVKTLEEASKKSLTRMCWVVWDDLELDSEFDFDFQIPNWDETYVHVFKNGEHRDGVCLVPKDALISTKESKHRFFVNKKEVDLEISKPKKYDIFEVDTYEEYLYALEHSTTEMFWATSRNIKVSDDFKFDLYFPHYDSYNRNENHVFVHEVNGEKLFNGIFLLSKNKPVGEREITHRFIIDRKEWDIVASGPVVYEKFYVDTYEEYLYALEHSKTEMFWALSRNIQIVDNFDFNLYFTHDNEYDRKENHAFIHRVGDEDFYNGLFLLSKHKHLSRKEVDHRFIIDRKEWDIVASGPTQYDIFEVDSYEEYLYALEHSKTEMFWTVGRKVKIAPSFKFDLYFIHDNEYDRKQNHVFKNISFENEVTYDGVFLLSKHKPVGEREIRHKYIIERKEWDVIASNDKLYDKFTVDTYEEYLYALEHSTTEMFWATSRNIAITDGFTFDLFFDFRTDEFIFDRNQNHAFIHRVDGKDLYNGVFLFSKTKPVGEKEINHRFIIDRKEWDIVASGPVVYDKFTVDTYEEYLYALKHSTTEMFWATSRNIKINFDFSLYFTHDNEYDRKQNHAFAHQVGDQKLYNGLFLFSKTKPVGEKEINHRFIIDRKEWDIVASGPVVYDIFEIDTYEEYLYALEHSTTEMFWATSRNIAIADGFTFDLYFTHDNEYDRKENHAFVHRVEDEDFYNGVFLFSKYSPVGEKEINHRFIINKKVWDIVASGPVVYDIFEIDTYEEYLHALETSKTELFWGSSKNIKIANNFDFSIYFTHDNEYDRKENHAFVHQVGDQKLYNGLFLFSKHKPVSSKEINHRFIIDRKEWDIVASGPVVYDKFVVDTYEDYLHAVESARTEMIWIIPKEVQVLTNCNFDWYFSHNDEFNRSIHHSFRHMFRDELNFSGVSLLAKKKVLSQKEIDFRFIVESKQYEYVYSKLKPYDVVFISYNEPNADENYEKLLQLVPTAKRVHGVKGIHNAHIKAAELSETENFWVVDGDASIVDSFKFNYEIPVWERDVVHIWHSLNPINNLEYGYGGLKLLPRKLTLEIDTSTTDMTTSISKKIKVMPEVSNYTNFNTDEFSTWKSAFRECVKLLSGVIQRADSSSLDRYNIWATLGADKPFGEFAIAGAKDAKLFVEQGNDLAKINDFDFLYERFNNKG